jgi:hypothetical protein
MAFKTTVLMDGHPTLRRNLKVLQQAVATQANLNAWNGAQHLFARSRAVVPYDKGDLYNAAYMRKAEDGGSRAMWVVGYDTARAPHAILVHEIPGRHHPIRGPSNEPKQDHYLSEPADAMRSTFPRTVANDLQAAIHRAKVIRTRR